MEFGLFNQAAVWSGQFNDPAAEHESLMTDVALIQHADKVGFKYAWCAEHHALAAYSHMSASESFIPYVLAKTERIHVGSGIWPLNPITNHPVRLAERVAMIDHLSEGRFEFGTGRGAGSWEIGTFGLAPEETKANWDEVIWELKKIWEGVDPRMTPDGTGYSHDGKAFSVPERGIYPKPFGGGKTHPPMWCAVGNLPTFEKAAKHGLGALGFSFLVAGLDDLKPYVDLYKETVAKAEPAGQYVNDNFLVATICLCLEDGDEARRAMASSRFMELLSYIFLYHDSFPPHPTIKPWPEIGPDLTVEAVDAMIQAKALICGSPDEVIEQIKDYEALGIDQLAFATPMGLPLGVAKESLSVFADKVMPHFDKDPVHRTTHMRNGTKPADVAATA